MSPSSAPAPSPPKQCWWIDARDSIRGVRQDYTTGPIGRAVLLLAIPMVLEVGLG